MIIWVSKANSKKKYILKSHIFNKFSSILEISSINFAVLLVPLFIHATDNSFMSLSWLNCSRYNNSYKPKGKFACNYVCLFVQRWELILFSRGSANPSSPLRFLGTKFDLSPRYDYKILSILFNIRTCFFSSGLNMYAKRVCSHVGNIYLFPLFTWFFGDPLSRLINLIFEHNNNSVCNGPFMS